MLFISIYENIQIVKGWKQYNSFNNYKKFKGVMLSLYKSNFKIKDNFRY